MCFLATVLELLFSISLYSTIIARYTIGMIFAVPAVGSFTLGARCLGRECTAIDCPCTTISMTRLNTFSGSCRRSLSLHILRRLFPRVYAALDLRYCLMIHLFPSLREAHREAVIYN